MGIAGDESDDNQAAVGGVDEGFWRAAHGG